MNNIGLHFARSALVSLALGLAGAACTAQVGSSEPVSHGAAAVTAQGDSPLYVTCSSDCSGTGGAPITESNCTTCSADNSSVTCNGVTTQCQPPVCVIPPKPRTRCPFGLSWNWCGCNEGQGGGGPQQNGQGWVCGACD